jgi:hypothetical protein
MKECCEEDTKNRVKLSFFVLFNDVEPRTLKQGTKTRTER